MQLVFGEGSLLLTDYLLGNKNRQLAAAGISLEIHAKAEQKMHETCTKYEFRVILMFSIYCTLYVETYLLMLDLLLQVSAKTKEEEMVSAVYPIQFFGSKSECHLYKNKDPNAR